MAIVSQDDLFCRRTERLTAFVDEVRRYIYNECFNQKVSVVAVDCFCHDMFVCMARVAGDYSFVELLRMLSSDAFLKEAFARYRSVALS
jgi:hypothetical protein